LIKVKAEFKRWRYGDPEMPQYHEWVNSIIEGLRDELDSKRQWDKAKDIYLFKKGDFIRKDEK
jgi:hypothetical protein